MRVYEIELIISKPLQIEQTEGEVAAINGEMMTRCGRFSVKAGKPHSGGWKTPT